MGRFGTERESMEVLLRKYAEWKPTRPFYPHGFDLVSGRDKDIAWIGISGELDIGRLPEVEEEILKADSSAAPCIVINLRDVTYMDSSAPHLLLDVRSRMKGGPGRLRFLRSNHGPVAELLQVTQTEDALY